MTGCDLEILPGLAVSRETIERLKAYEDLVLKWTQKINLISRQTRSEIWQRHILDSAQLFPFIRSHQGSWIDLGSGGGLPGLVLAILAAENETSAQLHLIESDSRKAAFLSHVCRELALSVEVHATRIEALEPFPADLITARALASVSDLLAYSAPFTAPQTKFLLLKGQKAESELTMARKAWHIEAEVLESKTDPTGRILSLSHVRKRHDR